MKADRTEIRMYSEADENGLFDMLRKEPEWEEYWGPSGIGRYKRALNDSIVFVACDGNEICGYARCRDDDGFGVYIMDLLVTETKRGKGIGSALMQKVRAEYPNDTVYVMSGIDGYYEKLGYRREGTIFEVTAPGRTDGR